jgi:hypothetical protein
MEFTTSLSPRSWEKLTESKTRLRTKNEKLVLRTDLDALAEVISSEEAERYRKAKMQFKHFRT